MSYHEFLHKRQHYDFGDDRPKAPKVERKDSVEPDGRHKVELSLALETEAAQHAVIIFIREIDELHNIDNAAVLLHKVNWLEGYIAAMYATEAIDEEQAKQLDDILNLAAQQQARLLGIDWLRD